MSCRQLETEAADTSTLQELLKHFLQAAADLCQPDDSCAAAHAVVQELALYTGVKYLKLATDRLSDESVTPQCQLVQILQQHPQQVPWAVSLLQVSGEDMPAIVSTVLNKPKVILLKRAAAYIAVMHEIRSLLLEFELDLCFQGSMHKQWLNAKQHSQYFCQPAMYPPREVIGHRDAQFMVTGLIWVCMQTATSTLLSHGCNRYA